VLILHERRRLDLEHIVEGRAEEPFFVSVITASELLHGVHRAVDPVVRTRRSAYVESLLTRLPILAIDLPTARAHAQLWSHLSSQGAMIGAHDLWLAATAITHDLAVATVNVREFSRVPGLTVEQWT
jgi:predicted nucleic acid-binding protein